MTNKYLEKIAASYSISLGGHNAISRASLNNEDYKTYQKEFKKDYSTGVHMLDSAVGGLTEGYLGHLAGKAIGGVRAGRALGAAGATAGWMHGARTGSKAYMEDVKERALQGMSKKSSDSTPVANTAAGVGGGALVGAGVAGARAAASHMSSFMKPVSKAVGRGQFGVAKDFAGAALNNAKGSVTKSVLGRGAAIGAGVGLGLAGVKALTSKKDK